MCINTRNTNNIYIHIFTYGDKYCLLNMNNTQQECKMSTENFQKSIYPIFLPCRFNVSVPDILYCDRLGLVGILFVDTRRTDVRPKCSARLNETKRKLGVY